jgi:hypothetical protein
MGGLSIAQQVQAVISTGVLIESLCPCRVFYGEHLIVGLFRCTLLHIYIYVGPDLQRTVLALRARRVSSDSSADIGQGWRQLNRHSPPRLSHVEDPLARAHMFVLTFDQANTSFTAYHSSSRLTV